MSFYHNKNIADENFRNMCKDILRDGKITTGKVRPVWSDGKPAHTIRKFAVINRYDLSKEFPIITLRPVNFKKAIDELLWIWQRKSNNIKDLNSHVWDAWADKNGSIGRAYGYQLRTKHLYKEGWFDQVDRLIYTLKSNPNDRAMIVDLYHHEDLHAMTLRPCAHHVQVTVVDGKLNLLLKQRSQDVLVANGWNVVQYAILAHILAQISGYKVGELVHVIVDAHIYDRHIETIKELIQRPSYPAPKLIINPDVENFYDFEVKDFKLVFYQHGNQIKNIPVAE